VGRHRLAEVALGLQPGGLTLQVDTPPEAELTPAGAATGATSVADAPAGRSSVAPWLRVVPAPPQPDQLADTLPHPVVALFPLASTGSSTPSADTAEEQVFSLVDAEREQAVTAELAAGADVRPYRARHTA
jgi:hypothetical protein